MFIDWDLRTLPRIADFPYPVERACLLRNFRNAAGVYTYTRTEVCLRLDSNAESAEDLVDGRRIVSRFPHAVFKVPGRKLFYAVDDSREALCFFYSPAVTEALFRARLLPEIPIQEFEHSGKLAGLTRELVSLLAESRAYSTADRIDLVCLGILEELLFQRESGKAEKDPVRERIMRAASFLQMNLGSLPDVGAAARATGFSERSFFRHWRRFFSVTPARYMKELGMKRAAYLLRHTGLSVREIGESLGFPDDNYFSTAFRKFFHAGPLEYRFGKHVTEEDSPAEPFVVSHQRKDTGLPVREDS